MRQLILSFALLCTLLPTKGQTIADIRWPNPYVWPDESGYTLRGHVKSWVMVLDTAIVRKRQYGKKGNAVSDSSYDRNGKWMHPPRYGSGGPEVTFDTIRMNAEKVYENITDSIIIKDNGSSKSTSKFDQRKHLTEYTVTQSAHKGVVDTVLYSLINQFNEAGNILLRKEYSIVTKKGIYYWDNPQSSPTPFSKTDTVQTEARFSYTDFGKLSGFIYTGPDAYNNCSVQFTYDGNHHLTSVASKQWDYAAHVVNWKYDNLGRKSECFWQGYQVLWEYDKKNRITKETHYSEVSDHGLHMELNTVYLFDTVGNVVKETHYDYWQKKEYQFAYYIKYY